jgi:methionyl-tRNA formyltransferase
MRLIIFTNRDLASNYNLNLILPEIAHLTVRIFISDQVGPSKINTPEQLAHLKFFEQKLTNEIIFPLIEKNQIPSSTKKLLTFRELGAHYNIPVESLNEVRSDLALKKISDLNPDLVLSIRYGKIFGADFIKIPKLGVINLHSGKLPEYRGVLASFRAIMNGDPVLKTTLHYIDKPSIDTGAIIGHSEIPVNKDNSLLQHILELYPSASKLVIETIKDFARGIKPPAKSQPAAAASYYSFPDAEEFEEFEKRGWKLVDTTYYSDFISQYV